MIVFDGLEGIETLSGSWMTHAAALLTLLVIS